MRRAFRIDKKKYISIALFLIKFNLLAIPMYVLIWTDFSFQPLQNFLASLSYPVLKLFGYSVVLDGHSLYLSLEEGIYEIDISWDSTGWKSLYALAALVIATPVSTISKKLKFLFLALPTLFLINYFRIITTIIASAKFGFEYFEIVHTFLWREGLILAVVALWYYWYWRESKWIEEH